MNEIKKERNQMEENDRRYLKKPALFCASTKYNKGCVFIINN